jgi:hypothetical protein
MKNEKCSLDSLNLCDHIGQRRDGYALRALRDERVYCEHGINTHCGILMDRAIFPKYGRDQLLSRTASRDSEHTQLLP